MKTFFVVNPASANGSTGKRWGTYKAVLAKAVPDHAVEFTRAPLDAVRLTQQALRAGYQCVVAVGGDGTVNEVVNGFFDDGKPLAAGASLGVLPRGTGGDFRRTFGWESDFEAAVRRLTTPSTRPLDVGRCDFVDAQGKPATRYFANVCSFGASGRVDQEVARTTKALGGRLSFMLGSVKALSRYRDQQVTLRLDGGPPQTLAVTTLAVGNGRYFGGGMKVAPEADPSDGLFHVTVWSGFTLTDFVTKNAAIYSGRHVLLEGTRTFTCRSLTATSDEEVLIDCDGEQPGRLPCTMTVLPGALTLKV